MIKNFKRSIRYLFRNNIEEKIKNLECRLANISYEVIQQELRVPKVESIEKTIEKIKNGKSIARFGDGEFNLVLGGHIHFQKSNEILATRLREILASQNENLLIALPPVFESLSEFTEETQKYFRIFLTEKRQKIYPLLSFEKFYANAFCSRIYSNIEIEKNRADLIFYSLREIWQDKDVLIVAGGVDQLKYNIYDNAKSAAFLKVSAENSFDEYAQILEDCKVQGYGKLIILSVGPTATVLANDLCKLGFQALDLGHLNKSYNLYMNNEKYEGGW